MPIYESVMQEKPPIVLDIGTAYTKLGFAAEAYPRKIMPTEVVMTTTGIRKRLFDYETLGGAVRPASELSADDLLPTSVMPVYIGVQIMDDIQGSKLRKQRHPRGDQAAAWWRRPRPAPNGGEDQPTPAPDVDYIVSDNDAVIQVPGLLRESAYEIMFEASNERDSLPHLILRSILDCTLDVRRALVESLFLVGGGSMVQGLLARIRQELQHLLTEDPFYAERFHGELQFKFFNAVGKQNFTAWLGGALCGATDLIQTRSLVKETYLKSEHVPDWSNLCDNRPTGS
ncbi:GM22722 [Drosophila sechellia]|uniref:GM22722 n=1 Tax=Drosophila sechellia TaxID=7238 RepID=B4I791_DROSE|nr:GM22722 [Drosophila sechellia]